MLQFPRSVWVFSLSSSSPIPQRGAHQVNRRVAMALAEWVCACECSPQGDGVLSRVGSHLVPRAAETGSATRDLELESGLEK